MNVIRILFQISALLLLIFLFSCNEVKEGKEVSYAFDLDSNYMPQNDFFHFVNMKFIKEHRLKNQRNYFNHVLGTKLMYHGRIKAMYDELLSAEDENLSHLQLNAKYFYQSALDSALIEEDGDQAVRPFVETIPSIRDLRAVADYYYYGSLYGCYMPIYFDVELLYMASPEQFNYPRLHAFYTPLFPWDEFPQESEEFTYFKVFVEQTLKALNYDSLSIEKKFRNIVTIDKSIFTVLKNYRKDDKGRYISIAFLQKEVPNFDWLRLGENYGLEPSDTILVHDLEVLNRFTKVQQQYSDNQWFDYFEFNVYDSYAYLLPKKFREPSYNFNFQIGKTTIPINDSWENFHQLILNFYMTDATNQLYFERFCSPDVKNQIAALYEDVKQVFIEELRASDWIADATKTEGLKRIESAHFQIFYTEDENRYKNLQLKSQSLIRNFMEVCENHNKYIIQPTMNQSVDFDEFYYRLDHFYPFSLSDKRIMFIPVAFASPPYFYADGELYQNYAGLAVNIAHELSHMLDEKPGGYSISYNIDEVWWGNQALKAVEQIQEKIILQHLYFNYSKKLRIMNEVELYERLCDVSGFELAYKAFTRKVDPNEKPKGSQFTNAQLFFIQYAMVNKGYFDEDQLSVNNSMLYFYLNDVKVNSILSNSQDFYKAFGVKKGDGMYLPDSLRVTFWN